jgi:hypothetical protein
MRPRAKKAWILTNARRAAVVAILASAAVILIPAGSAKPAPVGNYQVCLSAAADACTATAAGGDYSVVSGGNPQLNVQITNDGSSNQTLDYADVSVPAGIGLSIDTTHSPQSASYATYAGTSTSGILQLRNLALAPGASKTVSFYVNSTSATCTDGNWSTVAKTGSQPSAFVFTNPPVKSSGLTSLVAQSCTLDFTYQPAAALVNTTITSQPYTSVAGGANNVTVTPHGLPVPLKGGAVSLGRTGPFDVGGEGVFQGTGPSPFSSGSVAFTGLSSTGTGGPFTLTASAEGFGPTVSSSFVVTHDGEPCSGACSTLTGKDAKGGILTSIATNGGFSFVGASPAAVPQDANGNYPAGCQTWTPTLGVTGFVEFDGRTTGGSMTITYYVSQKAIKAKYGTNAGQQYVPICYGAKAVDPLTQTPVDCVPGTRGWLGDELDASGRLTGASFRSICGSDGYYWGILGSYQDKFVPAGDPVVSSWNGSTQIGGNLRSFNISQPSGWDGRGGC